MSPENHERAAVAHGLHNAVPTDRREARRRLRALPASMSKLVVPVAAVLLLAPLTAAPVGAAHEPTAASQHRSVSWGFNNVNSYQDITNLHYRFVELLDQRDNAGMAALFENGTFELNYGRMFSATGEANVRALLQQLFPTPPTADNWSRHIVSNLIIDIDEELGTAATRMYSSAWGVRAGQPSHFRGLGRHIGSFERIDGEWVFKQLTIYADVDYPYPAIEPEEPEEPTQPQLAFVEALNALVRAALVPILGDGMGNPGLLPQIGQAAFVALNNVVTAIRNVVEGIITAVHAVVSGPAQSLAATSLQPAALNAAASGSGESPAPEAAPAEKAVASVSRKGVAGDTAGTDGSDTPAPHATAATEGEDSVGDSGSTAGGGEISEGAEEFDSTNESVDTTEPADETSAKSNGATDLSNGNKSSPNTSASKTSTGSTDSAGAAGTADAGAVTETASTESAGDGSADGGSNSGGSE